MFRIILIFIIVIFTNTLFGKNYSDSTFTARYFINAADSIAFLKSEDCKLLLIQSENIDSSGLSNCWLYKYNSSTKGLLYWIHTKNDSIYFDKTSSPLWGVTVLSSSWIDSDSALSVAESNGGRQFRQNNPEYTIEASLSCPLSPPLTSLWRIGYRSPEQYLGLKISADTGEITSITDITSDSKEVLIPTDYIIYQNYPNPFNSETTIKFKIDKTMSIRINFYNVIGQRVKTVRFGKTNAGLHELKIQTSDLSTGLYFYSLESEKIRLTKKCLLLR